MTISGSSSGPTRTALAAGFAAVYVIWGSTYLAIRVGVETLPPFLMAAFRFAVPGAALYAWFRMRGAPPPTRRQWRDATIAGSLLLLGGNGLVCWAEQWVPSGLAALIIASVPLWMGAMNWVVAPAERPGRRGIAGILLGFAGVAVLVRPGGDLGDGPVFVGALAIVLASALWAAGSLAGRHSDRPPQTLYGTALQMLGGAAALTVAGTLAGEWPRVHPGTVSLRSWLALLYLMTMGSMVALSAYVWLLRVTTPAKVSTYAYVNPVVAMLLGWAVLDETVERQTLAAASIIIVAVVLITTERRHPRLRSPDDLPSSAPEAP